jgi:glutamyl-tRNA reductase
LLFLATINQKTAPVAVRERFAFGADELPRALAALRQELGYGVIISTCNRTELYVDARSERDLPQRALDFLTEAKGLADGVFGDKFHFYGEADAVHHLFRVTAGIESQVLGEAEILGQVRSAFVAATDARSTNAYLARLFHSAIRVGRRARSETAISRHGLSVSAAAVALARKTLGDLSTRCVLVISAGEAGKLTAHALQDCGVARMLVVSRRLERAQELATELAGEAMPLDRLGEALGCSDIVITSSGSPSFIIGQDMLRDVMARRDGGPLLLIDIAVPRDIDPAVRALESVHLYDIDDLQSVAEANRRARQKESAAVEAIVQEEAARFLDWSRSLAVVPTISALRRDAEKVRRAEVAKTLAHLPDLTDQERQRIERLSEAIVKKILHRPISRLKAKGGGQGYVEAARELFGIDEKATQAGETDP